MLHICPTMADLGLNILAGECLRAGSSELLDMMPEQPENKKDVCGGAIFGPQTAGERGLNQ